MITIYQIQMSDTQVDAFNAGTPVPAIEAKRKLMLGADGFNPIMLKYFTEVARVNTDNLEYAFELTNLWNDESKVEKFTQMSSTSVGDIFRKDDRWYMVDSFGFAPLMLFNDEIETLETI